MKLILSTLSSPQTVCITKKQGNGSLKIVKRIHINGGANVADRKTLLTPAGVVTELTDEDYVSIHAPRARGDDRTKREPTAQAFQFTPLV